MSELCAYDIDGTLRPGCLVGEAIVHAIDAGMMDAEHVENPHLPTGRDLDYFVQAITRHPRTAFTEVIDRIADEAETMTMPWALERLESQKAQGLHRAAISLSPDFLVRAYASGIGLKPAYGSYFHTRDAIFSGHAVTRHKTRTISRILRKAGLPGVAFAAGDSMGDVPMLSRAREAAVVNPDQKLGEIAVARGWEIIRTEMDEA